MPDVYQNWPHAVKSSHPSRLANPVAGRKQPESNPDWIAWTMQLVFGAVVGFGIGFVIARLLWRSGFIGADQILAVIGGIGMCCGAFTSLHGDRAWLMPSIFSVAEPRPARQARLCSMIIGMVGVACVIVPVLTHVFTVGWPTRGSGSVEIRIFALLIASVPGFLLVYALRTGSGVWALGFIDREQTPLLYWAFVLINAVAVLCILSTAIQ